MQNATLKPELQEEIESIMDQSNEEYDNGEYLKSIKTMEKAWDKLPEPKGCYEESYHIVMGISDTYLLMKEYKKAQEWAEKIYTCALDRIDSGEREFLSGKIAYEAGELDKAKEFFKIANQKSDGRCFEDEDGKYKKFFKNK